MNERPLQQKRNATCSQRLQFVVIVLLLAWVEGAPVTKKEYPDDKRTFLLPRIPHLQYGLQDIKIIPTGNDVRVTLRHTRTGGGVQEVAAIVNRNFSISPVTESLKPFLSLTNDLVIITQSDASVFINVSSQIIPVPSLTDHGMDYVLMGSDFRRSDTIEQFVFIYAQQSTEVEICPFKDNAEQEETDTAPTVLEKNCFHISVKGNGAIFLNNETKLTFGVRIKCKESTGVISASSSSVGSNDWDIGSFVSTHFQLSPMGWEILPPVSSWGKQFVIIPLSMDNEFLLKAKGMEDLVLLLETPEMYMQYDLEAYGTFSINLTGSTYAAIHSSQPVFVQCNIQMKNLNETENKTINFDDAVLTTAKTWVYITDLLEMVCSYSNSSNLSLVSAGEVTVYQPVSVIDYKLRHLEDTFSVARFRDIPNGFYTVMMDDEAKRCDCSIVERYKTSGQFVSFSNTQLSVDKLDRQSGHSVRTDLYKKEHSAESPQGKRNYTNPLSIFNQSKPTSADDIILGERISSERGDFSNLTQKVAYNSSDAIFAVSNSTSDRSEQSENKTMTVKFNQTKFSFSAQPDYLQQNTTSQQILPKRKKQSPTEEKHSLQTVTNSTGTEHRTAIGLEDQRPCDLTLDSEANQTSDPSSNETKPEITRIPGSAQGLSLGIEKPGFSNSDPLAVSKNNQNNKANKTEKQNSNYRFNKVLEVDTYIDKSGRTKIQTSQSVSSNRKPAKGGSKSNQWNPTYMVQSDDKEYDEATGNNNLVAVIVSLSAAVMAVLLVISIFLLIEVFSKRKQLRNTRIRPFLS